MNFEFSLDIPVLMIGGKLIINQFGVCRKEIKFTKSSSWSFAFGRKLFISSSKDNSLPKSIFMYLRYSFKVK